MATQPTSQRRWGVTVWTPDQGLTELRHTDGAWRSWSATAPTPPGRLLAMVRAGKVFYAMVRNEDGGATRLLQFRRGQRAVTESAEAPWLRGAACVQL